MDKKNRLTKQHLVPNSFYLGPRPPATPSTALNGEAQELIAADRDCIAVTLPYA